MSSPADAYMDYVESDDKCRTRTAAEVLGSSDDNSLYERAIDCYITEWYHRFSPMDNSAAHISEIWRTRPLVFEFHSVSMNVISLNKFLPSISLRCLGRTDSINLTYIKVFGFMHFRWMIKRHNAC